MLRRGTISAWQQLVTGCRSLRAGSERLRAEGVVMAVVGSMLRVRWSTGEESSFVPSMGSITIVGRVRARPATRSQGREGTGTKAGKKLPAPRAAPRPSPAKRAGKAQKTSGQTAGAKRAGKAQKTSGQTAGAKRAEKAQKTAGAKQARKTTKAAPAAKKAAKATTAKARSARSKRA